MSEAGPNETTNNESGNLVPVSTQDVSTFLKYSILLRILRFDQL